MTRTTATSRESVQSDKSVVSGRPLSASVAVGAGLGPAGNNALSILDEGSRHGPSDTKDSAMCSRNRWRTVRKGNKTLTYKPDCMCWGCDECRPKLKAKWIAHGKRCFEHGGYLGYLMCGCNELDSLTRRLRRQGAKYLRVRLDASSCVVFISKPIPVYEWEFKAVVASAGDAGDLLEMWVNEIQDSNGGNPISSSRAWSLPSRNHSDWNLIAIGPAPSAVRSAAFLVLADFVERTIGGTPVAICQGETAKMDRLCEMIESLATGNPKAKERHHEDSDSGVIEITLEGFESCGDGHYSGRVLMT